MNSKPTSHGEERIDLKSFFYKIISNWYLFLITITLFTSIAYLYIRYSDPIYKANVTLLIRDKNNGKIGAESFLEGMDLFSSQKNVENEIGILSSYSMVNTAINNLDFNVFYYVGGNIKTHELYQDSPYKVILDTSHFQIANIPFHVDILSDSTFLLSITASNFTPYHFNKNKKSKEKGANFKEKKIYRFADTCQSNYFKFIIVKNQENNFEGWEKSKSKLYFVVNDIDKLTRQYINKLNVEATTKKGSIIKASIKGSIVQKEIDFLNKLSEHYILSDLEEKNIVAINTINFINQQLVEVTGNLSGAEQLLENYRESNKIMDLSLTAKSVFEKIDVLNKEKADVLVKNKYYVYLLNYVDSNQDLRTIIAPSSIGINDPLLISLINELNQLYSRRAAIEYGAEKINPSVLILNEKIKNAKTTLVENLKNILNSSKIIIRDLDLRIAEVNKVIEKLPKTERGLVSIQRQFNLSDHLYNYLLEKRAEAGIAKAANTPDNKIIDYATVDNISPISPDTKKIYSISVILAFLLPLLYISIKEFLNDKIRQKEELAKLTNIPMLGIVRHNEKKSNLPLLQFPKSAISESFRSLRINLEYLQKGDSGCTTIGITSAISGEGKTFCSINLAWAIAISGKKTLLIGADLRKPKINNELNLSNDFGLSSYLINKSSVEQIIQGTETPNLKVITSGPHPPNPVELLGSAKMKELFTYLKQQFDYIIIDSPPIGLVPDYLVLREFADSTLYIVRNSYTKHKTLENINEVHDKNEIKNLYIVLNDVNAKGMGYGYAYGYQYGYGYYDEGKSESSWYKKILNRISNKN
jgi:capsular exopolysaccharide synthesis family protein